MNKPATVQQHSAGGVAFRRQANQIEVALIAVGKSARWQLPKGLIDRAETPEQAAQREVREEAGIETELLQPIDVVEYWYYSTRQGKRIRYHKFVHFFLFRYLAGDVRDHDQEVNEARWVSIQEAPAMLAFAGEKKVMQRAAEMIKTLE